LNTHSKIIVDVINNLIEVDFRLKMEYVRGLIIGMSYQSQRLISFSEISGPGKIGNRGLGAVLTGLIKADFAENRPITSALVVNPSLRPGDGFFNTLADFDVNIHENMSEIHQDEVWHGYLKAFPWISVP